MFSTTKMSSRGQIVIPEALREDLDLAAGTEFMIISQDDAIILKRIIPPSKGDLRKLLDRAKAKAKKEGMSKSDIAESIAAHRKNSK